MLIEPMMEKLYAMKLNGMATAVEEQRKDPEIADLGFEDRLGIIVERQYLYKEDRALKSRLRYAGLNDSTSPDMSCLDYEKMWLLVRLEISATFYDFSQILLLKKRKISEITANVFTGKCQELWSPHPTLSASHDQK